MKRLICALALACSPTAVAQAAPSCTDEAYSAFDFWVGSWDVFDKAGRPAGSNVISREEGGCLLVERWSAVGGGTGQSYNFLDPGLGKWRQVWVSRGAVIDYAGGLNANGEMVMEGEVRYRAGAPARFRGTWTPDADGSVRQFFETYDPEAGVWTEWFTGIYRPKS